MAPPKNMYNDLKGDPSKISIGWHTQLRDGTLSGPMLQNVKMVSSYNWLSEDEAESTVPTIQVPGSPPLATFPPNITSLQLQPDSGHHYIDQNAARMKGRSGMVPGLAACYAYDKEFKIEDYDVVTDRNNLLKLFELLNEIENPGDPAESQRSPSSPRGRGGVRWPSSPRSRGEWRSRGGFNPGGRGRGTTSSNSGTDGALSPTSPTSPPRGVPSMNRRPETSRIDVDVVSGYDASTGTYLYDTKAAHKTLVLTRWEPKTVEIIFSSIDFRGFGFRFLTRTRQFLSVEDGKIVERGPLDITGFHCLVEYELFGLKILVRYHADACDMTREQFVRWIARDGLRSLEDENQKVRNENNEDEDDEDDEDTFDLLESFKTLDIKGKREDSEAEILKKHSAKHVFTLSGLPGIPLDIIHTPNTIFPYERIMQIKTRGKYTGLDREKLYNQLFFSQTRHVFAAYHSRGNFAKEDAQKEDITDGMRKWGEDNKTLLGKLTVLLREVRDSVGSVGGKGALVFSQSKKNDQGNLELMVHERE